jgi:hypothetical protein
MSFLLFLYREPPPLLPLLSIQTETMTILTLTTRIRTRIQNSMHYQPGKRVLHHVLLIPPPPEEEVDCINYRR